MPRAIPLCHQGGASILHRTALLGLLVASVFGSSTASATPKSGARPEEKTITAEQAKSRLERARGDLRGLNRMTPLRQAWAGWLFGRRMLALNTEVQAAKSKAPKDAELAVLGQALSTGLELSMAGGPLHRNRYTTRGLLGQLGAAVAAGLSQMKYTVTGARARGGLYPGVLALGADPIHSVTFEEMFPALGRGRERHASGLLDTRVLLGQIHLGLASLNDAPLMGLENSLLTVRLGAGLVRSVLSAHIHQIRSRLSGTTVQTMRRELLDDQPLPPTLFRAP